LKILLAVVICCIPAFAQADLKSQVDAFCADLQKHRAIYKPALDAAIAKDVTTFRANKQAAVRAHQDFHKVKEVSDEQRKTHHELSDQFTTNFRLRGKRLRLALEQATGDVHKFPMPGLDEPMTGDSAAQIDMICDRFNQWKKELK
jgi:hypothetical protein